MSPTPPASIEKIPNASHAPVISNMDAAAEEIPTDGAASETPNSIDAATGSGEPADAIAPPLKPRKPRPPTKAALKKARLAEERHERRGEASRRIRAVVECVATARGVDWNKLFSPLRESPAVASARVLAMAMCCAVGVPQYMVARAFSRNWATVFSAEQRCGKLYRMNAVFRKEWDEVFERADAE